MRRRDTPTLGKAASEQGGSWAWFQGGFGSCGPAASAGYGAHHNPFQYFTSTADPTHAWAWNPKMNFPQPDRHERDLQVFYAALSGSPIGGVVPRLPPTSWVTATKPIDAPPRHSSPLAP